MPQDAMVMVTANQALIEWSCVAFVIAVALFLRVHVKTIYRQRIDEYFHASNCRIMSMKDSRFRDRIRFGVSAFQGLYEVTIEDEETMAHEYWIICGGIFSGPIDKTLKIISVANR
jgi:hypothetical protein